MGANVNLGILIGAKDMASRTIDGVTGSVNRLGHAAGGGALAGLGKLTNLLKTGLVATATAATAAIAGLAAGITSTTMEAGDMEQKVADIAAVMGLAKDQTAPLKALIQDLGIDPKLKVSATEAAGAVEMLARNGLSMDAILGGAARSTVLLANSTGIDLSTAADIATDAMAIFKIEAKDMTRAVNGLVGVTNSSKFTMNDYALALGTGAKGASAANVSFEQFNQMLVATASNFTSGMTAGTGLTAMMLGLAPQTDKAKGIMQELGIITAEGKNRFFDMNGEMRSNAEIAQVMRETLGKLNTEQRLTAVDALFGRDALAAVNGMIATTTDQWGKYAQQLANTDAEASAATRMDTMRGALEILQGVFETLRLQIGDKFVPAFRTLIESTTAFLTANGPMLVEWAGQLATRLEGWIDYLIKKGLPDFVEGLTSIYRTLTSSAPFFDKFKTLLTSIFGSDVMDPLWRFIDGFAEIAQLAIHVFQGWVPLSTALQVGWWKLVPIINTVAEAVRNWSAVVTDYIVAHLPEWLKTLAAWGKAAWNWIVEATPPALAKLGEWGAALMGWIGRQLPGWVRALGEWAKAAWNWIVTATPTALSKLGTWIGEMTGRVARATPDWVRAVGEWGKATWTWLVEATPRALSQLAGWASSLYGWLSSNLPIWIATLGEWAKAAWNWIAEATPKALSQLGTWIGQMIGWLGANLPNYLKAMYQWQTSLWQWIGESVPKALAGLSEWLLALLGWGTNEAQPGLGAMAATWFAALFDWIANDLIPNVGPELLKLGAAMFSALAKITLEVGAFGLKLAVGLVTSIAQGLLDLLGINVNLDQIRRKMFETIDGWKTQLYEGGASIVKRIGEGITAFLKSPSDAIRNVISAAQGVATGLMDTLKGLMQGKGSDAVDALAKGFNAVKAATVSAAQTVFKAIQDAGLGDGGIGKFATKAGEVGKAALTSLSGAMTAARDAVKAEVATTLKNIEEHGLSQGLGMFVGRMYERARAGMLDFARGINETAPNLKTDLATALSGTLSTLTTWWNVNKAAFLAQGTTLINEVLNGINAGAAAVGAYITPALTGIYDFISSWITSTAQTLYTNAVTIGNQIVSGIGNGITTASATLQQALQYLASILPQWVKDILGIGSASASSLGRSLANAQEATRGSAANAFGTPVQQAGGGNTTTNSSAVYNQFTIAGSLTSDRDAIEQVRLLNMLYATGTT